LSPKGERQRDRHHYAQVPGDGAHPIKDKEDRKKGAQNEPPCKKYYNMKGSEQNSLDQKRKWLFPLGKTPTTEDSQNKKTTTKSGEKREEIPGGERRLEGEKKFE